ncbi:MAG: hypothetical protein HY927_08535 [Elusimicrobia bacterium]|nr:hypothetical protein [Elusimicrobiota bacterium]
MPTTSRPAGRPAGDALSGGPAGRVFLGLKLDLAGFVVAFKSRDLARLGADCRVTAYRKFITRKPADAEALISATRPEEMPPGRVVYDTPAYWQVARSGGKDFLRVGAANREGHFCGVLGLESSPGPAGGAPRRFLLQLDLSRVKPSLVQGADLVSRHIAIMMMHPEGILLHGAGLIDGRRGICLGGHSGAGKTTITRMLSGSQPGLTVLSDDKVALRRIDGAWRIYGTPWPGEGKLASNGSAPLERLLFLRQAGSNGLRRLGRLDATASLLRRVFCPWWDKGMMERTMETCDRLSRDVPAYELSFTRSEATAPWLRSTWTL